MPNYMPNSLYDQEGNRKYLNASERQVFYGVVIRMEDDQKSLFLLLLFWSGVRISEALSITAGSIDYEDQALIVRSLKKRDKLIYRRIPLPPDLIDRLKKFSEQFPHQKELFPWSRRTASRYVKSIMKACHLTGSKACAKGLRHSFAVHCVTRNIPLSLLSTWLGHSHLSTTTIYLNIIGAEERELAKRIW